MRRPRALLLSLGLLLVIAASSHAGSLRTDLSRALVPLDDIIPGGPSPDGIPAIDRPAFVTPARADAWLTPKEPVLTGS